MTRWRLLRARTLKRTGSASLGKGGLSAADPSFARVAVDRADTGVVEIEVGEVTLRIGPAVPVARMIFMTLKGS